MSNLFSFITGNLKEVKHFGLQLALFPHDDPPQNPPPSPTCSLVSCESHPGGHRGFSPPRSWVSQDLVEDCMQGIEKKMMEENYFVIRSSSFKLVSMLLMHPNLVAHNVKNIFKINKKD